MIASSEFIHDRGKERSDRINFRDNSIDLADIQLFLYTFTFTHGVLAQRP